MTDIVDNVESQDISTNENSSTNTEANTKDKILGRFDTHEELEKSYKELETAYSKKQNWEKKYTEDLTIPENYLKDESIEDIDDEFLVDASKEAKRLGLNQKQFNVYAKDRYDKKLEAEKKNEDNKVEIKENIKKFLKDDVGLTDNTINLLSKEDVNIYENKYQESLNTNNSVNNSYHHVDKQKLKKEAYRELKEAERTGNRFDKENAFKKWSSYL